MSDFIPCDYHEHGLCIRACIVCGMRGCAWRSTLGGGKIHTLWVSTGHSQRMRRVYVCQPPWDEEHYAIFDGVVAARLLA